MSDSIYDCVEQGPAIEVFALNQAFVEDTHPKKANLGVGVHINCPALNCINCIVSVQPQKYYSKPKQY